MPEISRDKLPEEQTAFLLSLASRRWRRQVDLRLRQAGVTYATWLTLAYLQRGGEGMLQKELAALMAIEAPSLVRLLDRLERDGLITRRAAPDDRRAKTVHLAAGAREVLTIFNEAAADVRQRLLAGISRRNIAACNALLERVIDNAARLESDDRGRTD